MMQKCENCKENWEILIKNAMKSKLRKICLSKYGCHGNQWTNIFHTKLFPDKF